MRSNGNRYDKEFKADIVRLVQEERQPVAKVANDFGISKQAIRAWLKTDEDKQDPEKNRIAELEDQLNEERKKTADLQQTVDILKKSVAIFIQDNQK